MIFEPLTEALAEKKEKNRIPSPEEWMPGVLFLGEGQQNFFRVDGGPDDEVRSETSLEILLLHHDDGLPASCLFGDRWESFLGPEGLRDE
jgi:hypothetical protein